MNYSMDPAQFRELLLSHHPDLEIFRDDVIMVLGRRICAGCLLAYPTAFLVWVFLRPAGIISLFIAVFLAFVSLFRKFITDRKAKHFFRFIAGIGLGFSLGCVVWSVSVQNWWSLLALLACGTLYLAVRIISIHKKFSSPNLPAV